MKLLDKLMYEEPLRGRPKPGFSLYALKSIVSIAGKYDLKPEVLIDTFVDAWKNKASRCEEVEVQCRRMHEDSATFLITEDEKVVAQFPLSLEALNNPERLKTHTQYFQQPTSKKANERKPMRISELRPGMRRVTVKATVRKIPPRRVVTTRWGGQAYVSNVIIADETGSIPLSLWNGQIDAVQVGDEVEIKQGYIVHFAGKPQLRLGRKGKLLSLPGINSKS